MNCYRCQAEDLPLAPLTPQNRKDYPGVNIVLRICRDCGMEQNHAGDDERVSPLVAAQEAPSVKTSG